jgi:hypothetical protein
MVTDEWQLSSIEIAGRYNWYVPTSQSGLFLKKNQRIKLECWLPQRWAIFRGTQKFVMLVMKPNVALNLFNSVNIDFPVRNPTM